jgi:hypothetical protein
VNTELHRRAREALLNLAHPREGVDTLKGCFGIRTSDILGVADKAIVRKV